MIPSCTVRDPTSSAITKYRYPLSGRRNAALGPPAGVATAPCVAPWNVCLSIRSAFGSMALTAYSGHIVALAILAYTDPGNDVLLEFTLTALLVCSAWVLLLGRGPLERLLTWVSHRAARIATPRADEEINHPIPRA